MARKSIVVLATLDTKGREAEFLARQIESLGYGSVLVDSGVVGAPAASAAIPREEVAEAGGTSLAELLKNPDPAIAAPVMAGELSHIPENNPVTDPQLARAFVEQTGIDALAVNIGQVHLHARKEVALNLPALSALQNGIAPSLVLHGASSVRKDDIRRAIQIGIRKINVGSILKSAYFEALRTAVAQVGPDYNP